MSNPLVERCPELIEGSGGVMLTVLKPTERNQHQEIWFRYALRCRSKLLNHQKISSAWRLRGFCLTRTSPPLFSALQENGGGREGAVFIHPKTSTSSSHFQYSYALLAGTARKLPARVGNRSVPALFVLVLARGCLNSKRRLLPADDLRLGWLPKSEWRARRRCAL